MEWDLLFVSVGLPVTTVAGHGAWPWHVAMCRDIKKMDYAKKHLTNTITALRRLAMLTAAVAGEGERAGRRGRV